MPRRGAGSRAARRQSGVGRGVECTAGHEGLVDPAESAMVVTATAAARGKARPFDPKSAPGRGRCERWPNRWLTTDDRIVAARGDPVAT